MLATAHAALSVKQPPRALLGLDTFGFLVHRPSAEQLPVAGAWGSVSRARGRGDFVLPVARPVVGGGMGGVAARSAWAGTGRGAERRVARLGRVLGEKTYGLKAAGELLRDWS